MAMQKIYQTFVALAAQLQSIHENVKVSIPHQFTCLHIGPWELTDVSTHFPPSLLLVIIQR